MIVVKKEADLLSGGELQSISCFLGKNFSSIFHETGFNRIIKEAFRTNCFFYLIYNSSNELVALCPVHALKINALQVDKWSGPAIYQSPYGGWVYDNKEVKLPYLMSCLETKFNEALFYWSLPQIDSDTYAFKAEKIKFLTAVIDLSIEESKIWETYISSEKRNKIRKALKNDIVIEMAQEGGLTMLYKLYTDYYTNTAMKIKPLEFYLRLFHEYSLIDKIKVFLAKKKEEVLAGLILLRNRFICHYWFSAIKKNYENLGQGDLLQWEAIKWSKAMGSRYYDLCVVEPERLPDIAHFKLGFSKNLVPFYLITKKSLLYRACSKFNLKIF